MGVKKLMLLSLLAWTACTHRQEAPRSATMRIAVKDTVRAVEAVTASAEALGGRLAEAEIWREGGQVRARLTLRVPPGQLTPTLASIRRLAGRVDSETVRTP